MVWVDDVLRYSSSSGECLIKIKKDSPYMDSEGLRASSCIEFIAQSYGYMSIAHRLYEVDPNSKPLGRAFLVAIKDAKFYAPDVYKKIKEGDTLIVKIFDLRQMGSITLFNGQVEWDDLVLCKAHLKVFSEFSS